MKKITIHKKSLHPFQRSIFSANSAYLTTKLGIAGGVLLLLLGLALALCCLCRRRRKASDEKESGTKRQHDLEAKTADAKSGGESKSTTPTTIPGSSNASPQPKPHQDNLPAHFVLAKDNDLRENAKKVSENVAELENEFKRMLGHVKDKVLKKTTVSSQEENQTHNRYKDIGSRVENNKTNYFPPKFLTTTTTSP